jgi:hypothetical protein
VLQRIPAEIDPAAQLRTLSPLDIGRTYDDVVAGMEFTRPEGSYAARSFGNALHAMLESLSRDLAGGNTASTLLAHAPARQSQIAALLRADGLPAGTVATLARQGIRMLESVLRDRDGLWVLSPHNQAASEFALTAADPSGRIASVRADRIFCAGPEPHAEGDDHLWIIDYKTSSHAETGLEEFLVHERETYAGQLLRYATILAPVYGKTLGQVRVALYFPALLRLVWWQAEEPETQPMAAAP